MAGNSFGNHFVISTFGESHGAAIGGMIDGCPAGISINMSDIQAELDRRRPGQSHLTTSRNEADTVEILSGIFEGVTTGAPIGFIIRNNDQKSSDYGHLKDTFRPSHADFTWESKYGIRDYRGGGRSSARETACRVVAGSIAKAFLAMHGIEVSAWVNRVQSIEMPEGKDWYSSTEIESSLVRCPHPDTATAMENLIASTKEKGDTVGGSIRAVARGMKVGLGQPVFHKLHADIASAMMSINAVKGFEYGSGIAGTYRNGSEENDGFAEIDGKITTLTNRSGGIQGGISNGAPIVCTVHFKPVATIMKDQQTVNKDGETVNLVGKGRHDACVLPRAVPIVESMLALTLADQLLKMRSDKVL
ncbi:MAG: chorismate synthase [Cryomorphaceae bacterium]|nr:chorismate synthase [Cryomorphaceae bacterium]